MIVNNKFYKNSNTGELIKSTKYTETKIDFPIYFYDINGNSIGENLDITGFVEISEKKWNRYKRKNKD